MLSDDLPVDTYAILPGSTLFSDIIRASLLRLGYSRAEMDGAVGGIQLKNWRTLPFDVISDQPDATVEELLGEITSVATLRIRLSSKSRSSSGDQVKEKLLQLLLTQSKDFLVESGCPIEKNLLDAISNGQLSQTFSDQVCTAFNQWYGHQTQKNSLSKKESSMNRAVDENNVKQMDKISSSSSSSSQSSERNPSNVSSSIYSSSSSSTTSKVSEAKGSCNLSSVTPSALSSVLSIQSPLFTSAASSKGKFPGEDAKALSPSHMTQPEKSKIKREASPHEGHGIHDNGNFWAHQNSHQSANKREHGQLTPHDHPSHQHNKQAEHMREGVFSPPANDNALALNFTANNTNSQAGSFMGIMPGKTRIRTSFDPEHEIPRLQKWFSHNQHPTRDQMMKFMQELNRLESRKGRRPLDLTNIIYWFKNARAAQRRATKAADDSFDEEKFSSVGNNECSDGNLSEPPYLPNKNAVYMIPFPPYPHLVAGQGNSCRPENNSMNGVELSGGCEEPYDLSIAKHISPSSSDSNKVSNKRNSDQINSNNYYSSHSPLSKTSAESTDEDGGLCGKPPKKRMAPQCQPRLPALLDVVSRMRREIPSQSDDPIKTSNVNQRSNSPHSYRPRSTDTENNLSRMEDFEPGFSDSTSLRHNGCAISSPSSPEMQISVDSKSDEERRYSSDQMCSRLKSHVSFERDSDLELGQIKKENGVVNNNNNNNNTSRSNNICSDDENSNDSYDSEEELKMRMKQNAVAVADYMNSNVSRLTAANMAALSLAQMGQSLHIPQLPPSLAMAYYPMDPRFYSQASVPTSIHPSSSTSPSLPPSSSSHLTPRQGQTTPTSHLDSPCPLPSPSSLHHSMAELNHQRQRHHHHQQQQQHHQQDQQHSDQHHQQQSMRPHSEPRKRRTRVFIDPLSEIPKLEKWFIEDTHPSAFMIDKYCEELNKCEYRQKFPKLEPKNVQLWFKNHRAKVKRLTVSFNGKVEDDGMDSEDMQGDGRNDGMRNDSKRWMMERDDNEDSSQNFDLKQEIAG